MSVRRTGYLSDRHVKEHCIAYWPVPPEKAEVLFRESPLNPEMEWYKARKVFKGCPKTRKILLLWHKVLTRFYNTKKGANGQNSQIIKNIIKQYQQEQYNFPKPPKLNFKGTGRSMGGVARPDSQISSVNLNQAGLMQNRQLQQTSVIALQAAQAQHALQMTAQSARNNILSYNAMMASGHARILRQTHDQQTHDLNKLLRDHGLHNFPHHMYTRLTNRRTAHDLKALNLLELQMRLGIDPTDATLNQDIATGRYGKDVSDLAQLDEHLKTSTRTRTRRTG